MTNNATIKATLWMLGGITCLSIIAISARELSSGMHAFQMLFSRSVIGIIILSVLIVATKQQHLFKTQVPKMHILRHVFHFAAQYGWFVGLGILPLAQVFSLEFTTPLWTMLIAALFLKENINLPKIAAILLGIAGVFIILRPDIKAFDTESIIVLIAALFFAVAHVGTKQLSKTENTLTILFYMCLIQLPLGGFLTINHWVTPDTIQWSWLLLMAIAALTAHFCITNALSLADAGLVMSIDFLRLPLISIVGIMFYTEEFDINVLLGGGLMVVGNLVVHYKNRKS